jgi:regulator of sigma E protease
VAQIRAAAGKHVHMVVLRRGEGGDWEEVDLPGVPVGADGTVGFTMGESLAGGVLVSLPPMGLVPGASARGAGPYTPAAASLIVAPGTRIVSVDGRGVESFADLRAALTEATADAHDRWRGAGVADPGKLSTTVRMGLRRPAGGRPGGGGDVHEVEWTLGYHDVMALHALGWEAPFALEEVFEPETFLNQATGPVDAVRKGLRETHRVMMSTYLTFARLAQGSLKVTHLKGPVGIAHLGTLVASQGLMKLLFFLALISVNLAVINFLPLPIVDGGQFLFLVYERLRGQPPPMAFQNAATLAGLVLIASVFLLVTFNDIRTLFGL